jgi:hypothetical protein
MVVDKVNAWQSTLGSKPLIQVRSIKKMGMVGFLRVDHPQKKTS